MRVITVKANGGTWDVAIELDNGDRVFELSGIPDQVVAVKQANKMRNALGRVLKERDDQNINQDRIQVWFKPEGARKMELIGAYDNKLEALKAAGMDRIRRAVPAQRYQWVRTGPMDKWGL